MGEGGLSLGPGPHLAAYLIFWHEYPNGIYTWLEKQKGRGIPRALVFPLVYIFIYTNIHRHMYVYIFLSLSLSLYIYVYTLFFSNPSVFSFTTLIESVAFSE